MIKAEIIEDSLSPANVRLTTFVLTYPRFIHSEFMTHRMISKNASSSRAIPVSTFMKQITETPAMPSSFSKNCKGMQAKEEIENQEDAVKIWLEARDAMMGYVQRLSDLGVHKQHANRLLEPFQHMRVVATATDWENFFALRTHKDAQPEFRELALTMWNEYSQKQPNKLKEGQWHLPFITSSDMTNVLNDGQLDTGKKMVEELIKVSVARCARTSYSTLDGSESSYGKDLELYDRLVGGSPLHASPTEHQAMATNDSTLRSGNLRGFIQYRKTLTNENITEFLGPKSE